ncbi:hypothetical protein P8452_21578 [Trifolium repens]|nr:callose synthase [Trifolium repens]WJX33366.1 hypothetical protein P8452_21578 [Trifolium repens]
MWSFYIQSFQAIIIIACHDLGSPLQLLDAAVFEDVISIFPSLSSFHIRTTLKTSHLFVTATSDIAFW